MKWDESYKVEAEVKFDPWKGRGDQRDRFSCPV